MMDVCSKRPGRRHAIGEARGRFAHAPPGNDGAVERPLSAGMGRRANSPIARDHGAPIRVASLKRLRTAAVVLAASLLGACSQRSPSTMNPAGPGARTIVLLWWVMFGVATFVILLIG